MQKFAKVKIIFNAPCEILGGLSRYEAGVVVRKLGVLNPWGGVGNSMELKQQIITGGRHTESPNMLEFPV